MITPISAHCACIIFSTRSLSSVRLQARQCNWRGLAKRSKSRTIASRRSTYLRVAATYSCSASKFFSSCLTARGANCLRKKRAKQFAPIARKQDEKNSEAAQESVAVTLKEVERLDAIVRDLL